MTLRTTAFVLCLGLSASGIGQAAPPPAPTRFVLRIDGGNAYVFSQEGRVDVGPVAPSTSGAAAGIPAHTMVLKVQSGVVKPHPDWPAPPTAGGAKRWALAGHEVWPCPDGVCPNTRALTTSPDEGPDATNPCRPKTRTIPELPTPVVDNLYYLPDLLALHGSAGLPADWHARLAGRLVLLEGKLVLADTFDCVELTAGGAKRRHAVAHGHSGMQYVVPVQKHMDLVFKAWPADKIVGAVRIVPQPGKSEIAVHLTMPQVPAVPHMLMKGTELTDFRQFYELLPQVAEPERVRMKFEPDGALPTSPGADCGSARFGGPVSKPAANAAAPSR
jgi:hypothetical protein